MGKKILIVGGVAGGASVAARVRRIDASADIVMFEKGPNVSFSNCSLPFYLSGVVASSEALIMMEPEAFKNSYDIEARTDTEVTAIDRAAKKITAKDLKTGKEYEEDYDVLVLSPGARPVRPRSIKGIDGKNVFTIRNVVDITKLKTYLEENDIKDTVVVGGGFIGVEVTENLRMAGRNVALVEALDQIMMPFDYDMAQILHKKMLDEGVDLILSDGVSEIRDGSVVLASGKEIKAGAVIMAVGIAPDIALAKDAGIETGELGGIKVDEHYRTNDENIYAVGDAIEVKDFFTGKQTKLALAGPAQKEARAAADAIYGKYDRNQGVIGSSVVKMFDLNAAATGMNEKKAKAAGINYEIVYVAPMDKVGIMPGASPIHLKLIFEVPSGRVLGAQAIGMGNVDKRIDVIATIIHMKGTVRDLTDLELCYAPYFGTAKDAVNFAGLVAQNLLDGVFKQVHVGDVRKLVEDGAYIADIREPEEYEQGHIVTAVNIPLSQLRKRMDEIPKDRPVYLHCRTSQRSYNALMALKGNGWSDLYNISGSYLELSYFEYFDDKRLGRKPILTDYNFE